MIATRVLDAREIGTRLEEIAGLRIKVFRAYPYLYQGDLDYERNYLEPYLDNEKAIVVGAFDDDKLIGAATGTPLVDHADEFGAAFEETGINTGDVFYNAESVLLPEYRGRGIGHVFFDEREAHARRLEFGKIAFCAVVRPQGHPKCPPAYSPLDAFWKKRGYAPLEGVTATYNWRDIGDETETPKAMQFWMRDL